LLIFKPSELTGVSWFWIIDGLEMLTDLNLGFFSSVFFTLLPKIIPSSEIRLVDLLGSTSASYPIFSNVKIVKLYLFWKYVSFYLSITFVLEQSL